MFGKSKQRGNKTKKANKRDLFFLNNYTNAYTERESNKNSPKHTHTHKGIYTLTQQKPFFFPIVTCIFSSKLLKTKPKQLLFRARFTSPWVPLRATALSGARAKVTSPQQSLTDDDSHRPSPRRIAAFSFSLKLRWSENALAFGSLSSEDTERSARYSRTHTDDTALTRKLLCWNEKKDKNANKQKATKKKSHTLTFLAIYIL